MSFASPGGKLGLATALVLLFSAPLLAQTAPAPTTAPTRPQTRPATPPPAATQAPAPATPQGQPAPQGQNQAQNAGPTIVNVKVDPSQPDWTKVCGKDPNAASEMCFTTRDFVNDQGQVVIAVALYEIKANQQPPTKIVRFFMPVGLLLQPGLRFAVDQGQANAGKYTLCIPTGCFADAQIKDDFIAAFKKGTALNVSAQNPAGREVTFVVPAAGFGKAYDGPAIDPKVLEEQ